MDDTTPFRLIREIRGLLFSFLKRIRSCCVKPKGITIEHLWLASPFFVILVRALRVPLPLLDFWWHLKMGEIIVSTRSIPQTDLFSFTASGKPFIVQNWLVEILYYKLYQLGGLPLLALLNAVLLAAALLPVCLLCRESTHRNRLIALSQLLACLAFAYNARPQVFSLVLFAFFYWVLEGYRFHRWDKLWLLPLAMIVWVNLHGAFVVGLGLLAIYLGSESIRRLADSTREDTLSFRQLRKLGLVWGACIAATLVNPQTYKVYDYIRVVILDRASQRLVMEWQPPRIDTLLGIQMFFGLFGLTLLGLIYSHKRPNLSDLALFWGFCFFALMALRNTCWFAIIVAPMLARYWAEMDLSGIWGPLGRLRFPARTKSAAQPRYGLNLMFAVSSLAILIFLSPWVHPNVNAAGLSEPQTPVKAVDYIEQHRLSGHLFHPQIFGDYLIWRLYPQQRSFIDGRVHLFGETFAQEYQKIFYDSHWEEKLASFDIQYLLLSKDAEQLDSKEMIQKAQASGKWAVLFEDSVSILFAKMKR